MTSSLAASVALPAPVWHRHRRVATPSLLAAMLAPQSFAAAGGDPRATSADLGMLGWLQVGMETLAQNVRHTLRVVHVNAHIAAAIHAGLERAVPDPELRELLHLAGARPELAWTGERDIADARHAHATNSPDELAVALATACDWLEGDVRLDPSGRIVLQHNPGAGSYLTLDEWLLVGLHSGRGLKLDFKESDAIVPAVHRAARMGVPSHRFIINVTIQGERGSVVTLEQLREVRRVYPDALVNISVCVGRYDERVLERMSRWARAAKGPTMFPLRYDLVSRDVVQRVRPFGRVAIWNEPSIASPACVERASRRLRTWGVDGVIDLRAGARVEQIARPLVRAFARTFGWEATVGARRLGSQVRCFSRRAGRRTDAASARWVPAGRA